MTKNDMQNILELAGYKFERRIVCRTQYDPEVFISWVPSARPYLDHSLAYESSRIKCLKKTWEHYELCK
jgi:hypothetical protein